MIITLSTDSNYVKHSSYLLKSIAVNSPHVRVHCRAVDCTDFEIELLQGAHPGAIIINEQLNLPTKRQYFRAGTVLSTDLCKRGPHGAHLLSHRQCYVSNTRYRNILYCLEVLNEDIVILLDADAIVRKDLTPLTDFFKQYDVLCNVATDADRYPRRRCWECSCIVAVNNNKSIDFFKRVQEMTEESMTDWDSDQFAIENVYNLNQSAIKLCEDISHVEDLSWRDVTVANWNTISYNYNKDNYIWPGSGEAKFTKPYLDEQSKYK